MVVTSKKILFYESDDKQHPITILNLEYVQAILVLEDVLSKLAESNRMELLSSPTQ